MSNDASARMAVGRFGARRYRRTATSIWSGLSGIVSLNRCSIARSESAVGASTDTEYPGTFSAMTLPFRS